ncbi:MAG: CoA-binding protein [Deltaproteobacteria bacterium]|nr:CoA-binding protein [Deltaproteobacteria bacterium]
MGMLDHWVNLLSDFGYRGSIYPIHPHRKEMAGLKVFRVLSQAPEPIDLAILSVPASLFPEIIHDWGLKGAKAITGPSGGFSEAGTDLGKNLEAEVVRLARQSGIRIIGPNCLGIYCPGSGLTFCQGLSRQTGPVGYISQSGTNATRFVRLANMRGIYFSKAISYGNAADLKASDFIEYFANDPETKIVTAYIEGVKDGQDFFRAVKECTRRKPVIILKGGLTSAGSRATSSHTGSLGGSESAWNAFFRQTGAIRVDSLEEMADVAMTFLFMSCPKGRRAAIVGSGAGGGVLLTDACERAGLLVPPFLDQTRNSLESLLPSVGASAGNPVDGGPPVADSNLMKEGLRLAVEDTQIDFLIVHLNVDLAWFFFSVVELRENIEGLIGAAGNLTKPAVVVLHATPGPEEQELLAYAQQRCGEADLPVYTTYEGAAKGVSKFIWYHDYIEARSDQAD